MDEPEPLPSALATVCDHLPKRSSPSPPSSPAWPFGLATLACAVIQIPWFFFAMVHDLLVPINQGWFDVRVGQKVGIIWITAVLMWPSVVGLIPGIVSVAKGGTLHKNKTGTVALLLIGTWLALYTRLLLQQ